MVLTGLKIFVNSFILGIYTSNNFCAGDIFNAQVELESIFDLRQSVSDAISEYLVKEELRLSLVREKFFQSSGLSRGQDSKELSKDGESRGQSDNQNDGMLNPINAFVTIKALSEDLIQVINCLCK